jgi:hypothetical protein
VIHALLDNPRFGLAQARLAATHHRTPAGLEALAARAAFAADAGVRRALLRNPQLPAGLLRRLYGGRRLLEQHKLVISRDVPEQTRRVARELLRTRFSSALRGQCLARPRAGLLRLVRQGREPPVARTRLIQPTIFAYGDTPGWKDAPPALDFALGTAVGMMVRIDQASTVGAMIEVSRNFHTKGDELLREWNARR